MGNLFLETTINFLIAIAKMFYISQYVIVVTTSILEKLWILNKEYVSTNRDVKHPQNITCRECAEHIRDCAKSEPFFQIYPFYHEKDHYLRDYKEKTLIIEWKPPLNINKT